MGRNQATRLSAINVLFIVAYTVSAENKLATEATNADDVGPLRDGAVGVVSVNDLFQCKKYCRTSTERADSKKCWVKGFKGVDKSESKRKCFEMCRDSNPFCTIALFVKPREPSTFDLHGLYAKVLRGNIWLNQGNVKGNEPGAAFDPEQDEMERLRDIDSVYSPQESHLRKWAKGWVRADNSQGEQRTAPDQDLETIASEKKARTEGKTHEGYGSLGLSQGLPQETETGSCYTFDANSTAANKFKCRSAHMFFEYDQMVCEEDVHCVRSKRLCPCGRCGPSCESSHYRHVADACMGSFFFGHKTVGSLDECLEFCLDTPGCKSVDMGSRQTCLLNFVNRTDHSLIMGCDRKNNEHWDYYEIVCDPECPEEKPRPPPENDICITAPRTCRNGGICESVPVSGPYQAFTYRCNCPCDFCGLFCDKMNMKTHKNACLKGSILGWTVTQSAHDCIDICHKNTICKSVSFSSTAGTCVLQWASTKKEALLPSSRCQQYQQDIEESEWTYFEIICNSKVCSTEVEVLETFEPQGCASNPCANRGECADIFRGGKKAGYHCRCPCGYCGQSCEIPNFTAARDTCIWGHRVSSSPAEYYRRTVTLSQCLSLCSTTYPICKSVNFSDRGQCYLNNKSWDEVTPTLFCNNFSRQQWTIYQVNCVCENQPILFDEEAAPFASK